MVRRTALFLAMVSLPAFASGFYFGENGTKALATVPGLQKGRTSARERRARAAAKPTSRIPRNTAVLACTSSTSTPTAASDSASARPGWRRKRKNRVSAAGTSTWRSSVPGCPSSAYEPPWPGASAAPATAAVSTARPSHAERKRAMDRCPELRDTPKRYRQLKDISESVRYDAGFKYSDEHHKGVKINLDRIIAIVVPKVNKL